jgi:hypothetical protein
MRIPIEPEEREHRNLGTLGRGPEKGFVMLGPVRHAAARHDAVREAGPRADPDAVPQGGAPDLGSGCDGDASEHAFGGGEARRRLSEEDTQPILEIPAVFRKRASAVERFERRAQEIARAAEIGERALMRDEPQLFPPFVEERLPQMRHERSLSGRDSAQQARRQDRDAGVQEWPWSLDAEGRDAVPFGLKRRVVLRVPVFRDEERRGAPRFAVALEESGQVGRDGRVGVDDEKVVAGQKRGGVAEGAGRPEDPGLREERELRKIHRIMAQVALDLVAQVMEINRYFADAGLVKFPEMRDREGDV